MRIKTKKLYQFSLRPKEDVYIEVEVTAPSFPGKHCAFYQLVAEEGVRVGEMLQLHCDVVQFDAEKGKKIKQIMQMGFSHPDDRKKVIDIAGE